TMTGKRRSGGDSSHDSQRVAGCALRHEPHVHDGLACATNASCGETVENTWHSVAAGNSWAVHVRTSPTSTNVASQREVLSVFIVALAVPYGMADPRTYVH